MKKATIILLVVFAVVGWVYAGLIYKQALRAVKLATEQQELIKQNQEIAQRCIDVATLQQDFIEEQLWKPTLPLH